MRGIDFCISSITKVNCLPVLASGLAAIQLLNMLAFSAAQI